MATRQARRNAAPATIVRTETVIRVVMRPRPEANRRRLVEDWLMRLLPPPDPDAMAGPRQARRRLLNCSQEIEHG